MVTESEKKAAESVNSELFKSEPGELSSGTLEILWQLFKAIGVIWSTVDDDSAGMRSQWMEFLTVRSTVEPSYIEEYESAARIIKSLFDVHGSRRTFEIVLLESGDIPENPVTRFEHFRKFVVAEFIHVHLVAGGFRSFGARNYKGFVAGSRFRNRRTFNDTTSFERNVKEDN